MSGNTTLDQIAQGLYTGLGINLNLIPNSWGDPGPIGFLVSSTASFTNLQVSSISTININEVLSGGGSDPTLVGRVAALETFSTAQTTIMYSSINTSNISAGTAVISELSISSISTFFAAGTANIQQVTELIDFEQNATGNWTHNFNSGSIFYHTNIASNFTTNLINVPTIPGRGIVTTLVLVQGATPWYSSTLTINGSAVPIQWAGASIPVPFANRVECESFTLLNIGGNWTALGQYTSFGTV